MGDDIQNIKTTAEDLAIERVEQQLADPAALNMQFLQSTLNTSEFEGLSAGTGFSTGSVKGAISAPGNSTTGFSGLSPAYSGAGLLGAVAVADMSGASSAMGMAAQVASAAPVTFGKASVGESANLGLAQGNGLTNTEDQTAMLKPVGNADGSLVPVSAEFNQLMAMLEGNDNGVNPDDTLMSLIGGLGQTPSPENLQSAIDSVIGQINLLTDTFGQVFDGLTVDVQNQVGIQNDLPSGDLGLSIFEDAGAVSSTLGDFLGIIDVGSNPQLDSLLNLDSTLDDVASLIGSLPDLDLSPVTDPVVDIIGGITEPVLDPVLDPILDPVTGIVDDVVGGITEPVIEITDPILDPIIDAVDPVLDPVTDPVADIIDPVIDPILEPITDGGLLSGLSTSTSSESDSGLLDSLSSGISSSAGSTGGALDGVLGPLDPNK